jgi:hypothetical protein
MKTTTFIGPPELIDGLIRHRVECDECLGDRDYQFAPRSDCDTCHGEGSWLDEDCGCPECEALVCGECGDPVAFCRNIECIREPRARELVDAAITEARRLEALVR